MAPATKSKLNEWIAALEGTSGSRTTDFKSTRQIAAELNQKVPWVLRNIIEPLSLAGRLQVDRIESTSVCGRKTHVPGYKLLPSKRK